MKKKEYTVMIPISIDGRDRFIKQLKIEASSVYEAHLLGVLLIEKLIKENFS